MGPVQRAAGARAPRQVDFPPSRSAPLRSLCLGLAQWVPLFWVL